MFLAGFRILQPISSCCLHSNNKSVDEVVFKNMIMKTQATPKDVVFKTFWPKAVDVHLFDVLDSSFFSFENPTDVNSTSRCQQRKENLSLMLKNKLNNWNALVWWRTEAAGSSLVLTHSSVTSTNSLKLCQRENLKMFLAVIYDHLQSEPPLFHTGVYCKIRRSINLLRWP